MQQNKGAAILWARPGGRRGYNIVLDGNRNYEWDLRLHPYTTPVPVPVKVGSRLVFQFRHFAYFYRVIKIDMKGVEMEVGGEGRALFFRNQIVFLPWK